MDIAIRIISIGYMLLALASIVAIPAILGSDELAHQIEGISVYKVPLIILNSCVLLFASYKAFKLDDSCLVWYAVAIGLYCVIATYDQLIRYGFEFYEHILNAFYYSLAFRVGTVAFMYYAFIQINLANKGS